MEEKVGFENHPDLMVLSESLSPLQKGAMAYAFLEVMMASKNLINLRMYNYIIQQFLGIHFKIESGYMRGFEQSHADGFLEILKGLTIEQKGWFLKGLSDMLDKLNVKPTDSQNMKFLQIEEQVIYPINKTSA